MPKADEAAVKDEEVKQDTSVQEPATEETEDSEVADDELMEATLDELESEVSDKEAETDGDKEKADTAETPADETQSTEQPQGEKPLAPKSENRFQKLANENRELKERLAQVNTQESQVAAENELMATVNPETGEYYTPQDAERIARLYVNENVSQSLAQEKYDLQVQQNQETLVSEAEKVLEDFPMFDDKSKDYNPEIGTEYDQLLKQALLFDDKGIPVGSSLSPYQLAKTIATATQANSAVQRAAAQKSLERMTANADTAPSASQATNKKVDPDLEGFDEEASR